MEQRELGTTGIRIAPLVFGGNVFGWTADQQRSFDLLDRFTGQGFNAIDTADIYSSWGPGNKGGESETVIGEWLARSGRRKDVVLMTKVGMWEARAGLSAANVAAAIDDSLRRLQTDHVDIFFAHLDDSEVPLAETLGAFSRVLEAGKARAIGASNYSAERLREALAVSDAEGLARYAVVQPAYNLHSRQEFEQELAPLIQQEKLGAVSFFSLASGFLTGKYRSKADLEGSARKGFLADYFDARGERILAALAQVSADVGAPAAQVSLAWLLSRPALTAPITSATSIAQLDEIMGAVQLQLPADALAQLDAASGY